MILSRRTWLATWLALVVAWTADGAPALAQGRDVLVFAAASMKNALDEIAAQWQRETGKKVAISYAASNTLIKQIEQGAPADIFISADLDWMDYGQQKDLIKTDTRVNLLGNKLVLIAPKDANVGADIKPGFDLAALLKGGRLAMANVEAVPAGKYGKASLEKLGVWNGARTRLPRRTACAPRSSWSHGARRRSASSTRPTPPPTPPSRSLARSLPTPIRRSSTPSL
jgi:molybdate transport system substrate-binding protein